VFATVYKGARFHYVYLQDTLGAKVVDLINTSPSYMCTRLSFKSAYYSFCAGT